MFGLPEQTLLLIINYFASRSDIKEVKVYGSRAIGTESLGSDIDLAIFTNTTEDIAAEIKGDLDDLSTPYLFDITDYQKITHVPLREHIDRVGKVLYTRKTSI